MQSIINIVTETGDFNFRGEIFIPIKLTRDAAENIMEAVSECLSDFKKENPKSFVSRITIESEKTGKILADLNFNTNHN